MLFIPSLFCFSGFAQGLTNQNQTLYESDGVTITTELADCVNPQKGTAVQYLLLEVANANTEAVRVSFNKELWHAGVCTTCNTTSNEHRVITEIPANAVIKGSCDNTKNGLRIYVRMLELKKVRSLSNYELKNIEVETIN